MKLHAMPSVTAAAFFFLFCLPCPHSMAANQPGKALVQPSPAQGQAEEPVVFRLGVFDRSSAEFSWESPKENVNFVAGQSDPARQWFAYHPAVSSAKDAGAAGIAAAPRAITFSLTGPPAAQYRLRIALLFETAGVPMLRVTVNGRVGHAWLQPRLDYNNGDQGGSFSASYSYAEVELAIPGAWLNRGANTITFQPVEEAGDPVPDAGVNYDAIELRQAVSAKPASLPAAQVAPTIFFVRREGAVRELVEAHFYHAQPLAAGTVVELAVGASRYTAALREDSAFGLERVEFEVSEFQAGSQAVLTARVDGRKRNWGQIISPAKKWTIAVVPHIHLDVGYSDLQPKVAALHARTIDESLTLIDKHPDFRFSLDGAWDLDQFLNTRGDAEQRRAVEAIKKRELFLPAQYANLLTGLPTAEVLLRSLYPSANLSRRFGLPLEYANITDVPSFTWSYPSILASAGIHYLVAGANNYRAPVLLQGRLHEASPFWWTGPDGQKVLMWYSRHYEQMQMLFGMPPRLAAGRETLPLFMQIYQRPEYRANTVIMYGTQVENTDLFPQQAELAEQWNSVYAYPHMEYAGFAEALNRIQREFGGDLPVISGDGGPYWEDGAASDAFYSALERQSEARAPSAEKLATLAAAALPGFSADKTELDAIWKQMAMVDEHTWDSYNSVSDPGSMQTTQQLAFKEHMADDVRQRVDFAAREALANLANAVPVAAGDVVVFNTLNWRRSGDAAMEIGPGDEIVDRATETAVPLELLDQSSSSMRVRFRAADLPAMGYKVYTVRHAAEEKKRAENVEGTAMENTFYRIQLDPESGAVRSVYDKGLGRELVDSKSPYRFGQYLYVTGGDKAPNSLLQYSRAYPAPALELHSANGGRLVSIRRTGDGETAAMECQGWNGGKIRAEIRLFDDEKKVEFTQTVEKPATLTKEGVYFAFPFAMEHPRFRYEVQTGTVDPAKDMYPGAGHEWFTVQHWASVEQDGFAGALMPLDAPLMTFGDINRGAWPSSFGERPATIFSYVMNNYWDTNYRASQGGSFTFRYIVTSAAGLERAELSRLGWEEATPLEVDMVTSQDKALTPQAAEKPDAGARQARELETFYGGAIFDAKQESFLETSDAHLLLETWKPAEDGRGTILRFLDLGGGDRQVAVHLKGIRLEHAWLTDALERSENEIPVSGDGFELHVLPHQILTVRIASSPAEAPEHEVIR